MTNNPEAVKNAWLNHINSEDWKEGQPGQWLCSRVHYEPIHLDCDPQRWRFTYEFTKTEDPDGYTYNVAYKDADGNIPSDASYAANMGLKRIDWHPETDFRTKFGA